MNAHDAVTALVARWYDAGDRSAGSELVGLLHRHAHPGPSFVRVLGQQRVEELAQDALVKLLDRERRALDGARDPFALVRAVARNLALSELRRLRRRERLVLVRSDDLGGDEVEDAAERCGDSERALHATLSLPLESRLAVLLAHAPDAIPTEDWAAVAVRHAPPPPERPAQAVDRDEASRLLWAPAPPEPAADRRRRMERLRRVLERAYARLAESLGVAD